MIVDVFCTMENGIDHISRALHAGANEYIMKPFDKDPRGGGNPESRSRFSRQIRRRDCLPPRLYRGQASHCAHGSRPGLARRIGKRAVNRSIDRRM
jgi:hypothetical protein